MNKTSKATPSTADDAVGNGGEGHKPGPANGPRAQLVQDLWEAFGFAGSPPSSKPAAFSGAMRLLDGKAAAGKELLAYINATEPHPEDGDSEAGFFLAYLKDKLAAPEGVGWRKAFMPEPEPADPWASLPSARDVL